MYADIANMIIWSGFVAKTSADTVKNRYPYMEY